MVEKHIAYVKMIPVVIHLFNSTQLYIAAILANGSIKLGIIDEAWCDVIK